GLVPLARFVLQPANHFRSERYIPFIGPLSIVKVLRKHAAPLTRPIDHRDGEAAALRFAWAATPTPAPSLRLLLAGAFPPVAPPGRLAGALRQWIAAHDLRGLTLEGSYARRPARRMLLDVPEAQYQEVAIGTSCQPTFNLISVINNH